MRNSQKVLILVIAVCITTMIGSCSTSTNKSVEAREVTSREAQIFSQILKTNHDYKNASFTVSSAQGTKSDFTASGIVDWENQRSSIAVTLSGEEKNDLNAISTTEIVYEKYSGLERAEADVGLPEKEWVSRSIDQRVYGVDSISQFVISLTAENAENPLLLKQDGAQLISTKESNGKKIYLFAKKNADIAYYTTEESVLIAVKVTLEGFTGPVLISFNDFGKSSVTIPDENDVNESSYFPTYFNSRPKF